jgi:hypothetical protein
MGDYNPSAQVQDLSDEESQQWGVRGGAKDIWEMLCFAQFYCGPETLKKKKKKQSPF